MKRRIQEVMMKHSSEKTITDAVSSNITNVKRGRTTVNNVLDVTGHSRYDLGGGDFDMSAILGDMFVVIDSLKNKVSMLEAQANNSIKWDDIVERVEGHDDHIKTLEDNIRCLRQSMIADDQ